MKIGKLKKESRYDSSNDRALGIQTYGENNDYPQQIEDVVNASTTGKSCVDVYSKFISGRGFADIDFNEKVLNRKGHTSAHILDEIGKDYSKVGGYAIHVNYNANYKIIEMQSIPIETIRFERFDDDRQFHRVALHPDWSRRFMGLFKWRKEDIDFIELFNPDPEVIQRQVDSAGGWHNYKGQIFYFSNQGEKAYPLAKYDSSLTDMSTQEGISNVSYRNARNGFFTAGMLVDYVNGDNSESQEKATNDSIIEFQGDEEACKIMYIQCKDKSEKPEFESFKGENYDKEFDATRKAVREDIGSSFSQPPILRAEDVGSNFGATAMKEAYNFYNSVTEGERMSIERVFDQLFRYWHEHVSVGLAIDPLSYDVEMTLAEELGKDMFAELMDVIKDNGIPSAQKRSLIKVLFNIDADSIDALIPNAI